MKGIFFSLTALLFFQMTVALRPLFRANGASERDKTGCYIVVLKEETSHEMFQSIVTQVVQMSSDAQVHGSVERVAKAFTVKLSDDALQLVRSLPQVKYVEEETMIHSAQLDKNIEPVAWHVDRLDQYNLPLDNVYQPNGTGEGVDIYIVDTGINYDHEEFENRAEYGGFDGYIDANTTKNQRGRDCDGHGTHVASLAAGKTYGAAKKARIYSIRVLDCFGDGRTSVIIEAADFLSDIIASRGRPAVVSMSISGFYSYTFNNAVKKLYDEGVIMIAAAGNYASNACYSSPGSSYYLITVGASDAKDGLYDYTNTGYCVDIFAPGEDIIAASYSCATCTATYSGTSMATPKVSGIAAIHLEHNPDMTPDEMKAKLVSTAAPDVLNFFSESVEPSTPNRLLYIGPTANIDCEKPPDIVNGVVSITGLTPGSVATYTCSSGYEIFGRKTRTCNFLGKWSHQEPQCYKMCPDLPYLVNGYQDKVYEPESQTVVVSFSCYYRYLLEGDEEITCRSDGTWSGEPPKCHLQCYRLYLRNGRILGLERRTIGTVVTYTCNDGYTLVGPENRTCLSRYSWSGDDSYCALVPSAPNVTSLCSAIVWRIPSFPYGDIIGYDVMLYHPESLHQTLIRRVQPNGTFYIISSHDNATIISHETYAKVRIVSRDVEGKWSEGTPLGCISPIATIDTQSVYFELNAVKYLNNSAVPLVDVGEGESALLCKTDKKDCCAARPNRFGDFYYPNGNKVAIEGLSEGFYRNRAEQLIHLNRREGTSSPTGRYRCEIPSASDEMANIFITLTE